MSTSQHFLLSYAASIFMGVVTATVALMGRDWLEGRGLPVPVVVIGSFILAYLIMRSLFRNLIAVKCPCCNASRAYPFKARGDRFRCENCGADF